MILAPAHPLYAPSHFVAADPGNFCGWAEFLPDGRLVACGLAKEPYATIPRGLDLLVIERPHAGEGKASKSDIITLSQRMGKAIAAANARHVKEVFPVQWKNSVPKIVRLPNGERVEPALDVIRRKLTPNDVVVLARCKSRRHDVLDAIGLGIWWCEVRGMR